MATPANVKDATTFPARADNLFFSDGKTVDNAKLTRFGDAIKASYPYPGGGAWPVGRPDANDAAAWLFKQASAFTRAHELKIAEAAVAAPSAF